MQVAAYARVSTQRQAQAQTTEQQLERLHAHAAMRGWALPAERVFRDDGCSGAALRRPGLDRLRDAAASAGLDCILITAPDRLARNYVHQVLLVEELQKHGAEVEFLDRPMSRDPHDQLLLQIRGAVAEYERTLITCTCLQSSALVLAIEGRFLLTLSETGDALVLTLSETGLTFAETCSQSGAAGAPWMRLVQIALQDTRPAQMGRPAAMSLAVIS